MSNALIAHLETIVEGESVTLLAEPANRLAKRLGDYVRLEAFLRWHEGRDEVVAPLPPGFRHVQRQVEKNSVLPDEIDTVYDALGATVEQCRSKLGQVIQTEKETLRYLERVSTTLGLRVKTRLDRAEAILGTVTREAEAAPVDGARGSARSLWSEYRDCVEYIRNSIEGAFEPGIINIAKQLIRGEVLRFNELDMEKLQLLKQSPLAKVLSLRVGRA